MSNTEHARGDSIKVYREVTSSVGCHRCQTSSPLMQWNLLPNGRHVRRGWIEYYLRCCLTDLKSPIEPQNAKLTEHLFPLQYDVHQVE